MHSLATQLKKKTYEGTILVKSDEPGIVQSSNILLVFSNVNTEEVD